MSERALTGQVAIITGGTSGIGRSTAMLFAEHGATVSIWGRNRADGDAVLAELEGIGPSAQFVEIDFADATAIGPAVERTIAGFGHIDILVNNAAARSIERRLGLATLFDLDVENWDYVQAVNLRAPFQLIQAVGRHMVERGTGGRIVNVGSSAASQARNTSSHYAASKAGLESLTRTAAAQLGPHGINVNNVAPGLTRTAYRQRMGGDEAFQRVVSQGPMENLMHLVAEPEDVAAVILFLCLPASRQITGQTIHTSAGLIV